MLLLMRPAPRFLYRAKEDLDAGKAEEAGERALHGRGTTRCSTIGEPEKGDHTMTHRSRFHRIASLLAILGLGCSLLGSAPPAAQAASSFTGHSPTVTVNEGQTATNSGSYVHPGGAPVTLSASAGDLSQTRTLFADTFDQEAQGLGKTTLTYWNATSGTVDVIGLNFADIYPGNGNYLDMDGLANGAIRTKNTFSLAPGTYELSFEIGNNPGGTNNQLRATLGSVFDETFPAQTALTPVVRQFTVSTAVSAALVFAEIGPSDAYGSVLDDVKLVWLDAPSAVPMSLNVQGYWQLGEDDPGAANGLTGNSVTLGQDGNGLNPIRDLNRTVSPTYSSAVRPNGGSVLAMSFDGGVNSSGDYYARPTPPVSAATDNFGIEAWVKVMGSTGLQLVANGTGTSGFGLDVRSGTYEGFYAGVRYINSGVSVANGQWRHIALVRDGGVTRFYVNGAQVYSDSLAGPNPATTGGLAIGAGQTGSVEVDDVRIFTFAPGTFTPQALLYNTSVSGSWSWSYATDDGPAESQPVTVTASTGVSGDTTDQPFALVVNNLPPTATFASGGPASVGGSGTVSFAGQADPSAADTAAGFRYAYDFDNNGSFEAGDGSYAGSNTAATATVPASFLTGAGPLTVRGRIIDKDGGFSDYTTTLAVSHAPVAVNDSYQTTLNQPLTFTPPGVLGNDSDADGDALTATVVTTPSHGLLLLTPDGAFDYIPDTGFTGTDSFSYTATDGTFTSNVATVTIEVKLGSGLLGYWKFDEGTGTSAADSSGTLPPNNGTLGSGAVFTTTAAPITSFADPGSVNLSGATNRLITVPNSTINQLTNTFTVMGWIRPTLLNGTQRVIGTAATTSSNGWSFGLQNNTLIFSTVGKENYTTPVLGLRVARWHHIAAVMDSSNAVSFYINGQFVSKVTGTTPATPDPDDVLLIGATMASGSTTPSEMYRGLIDDLRVYNRVLSGAEIVDASGVDTCSESVLRGKVLVGELSGTITLDGTCTYPLTFTDTIGNGLDIAKATTIEGNGATIARSPSAPAFRILNANSVSPASVLTIRNLTLRGGSTTDNGGGLNSSRELALSNVRFERNSAGSGGGLMTVRNLTLDRGFFLGNTSTNKNGNGGGLSFTGPIGRITNSVFVSNNVVGSGAAIRSGNTSNLTLLHNTFTDQYQNPDEAVLINGVATIQNNIFHNFKFALTASGLNAVATEDYNLFASNLLDPRTISDGTLNRGSHGRIAASPRFVDPAAFNYRLLDNSAALDLGTEAGVATDAAGNPRPYTGGGVDIGAYEYQGAGTPEISITKTGPAFATGSGKTQFLLTVINETTGPLNDLRIIEQLPAGATLVPGSISNGGSISAGTLTWDLPPLAPNQIERITYAVTATQDLVSDQYQVYSISNPAITASGPALTTPYTTTVTTLGFQPFPDGYSFGNYGDGNNSDVSADTIAFIFGADKVCKTQNPCVLTASAEAYRQGMVASNGGHCFGMALASLWIYDRPEITPGDYQSGAEITYDLLKANARALIQLFFSTQNQAPVSTTVPPLRGAEGATAAVDVLKANFANPLATDRYGLSFQKPDKTGGHAVTPYALRQIDADHYWIYVYDNNTPNNFDRVFKVTYSTGAWVYEGGATSPDAPPSTYYNDGTDTKRFWLTSLRYHESFPKQCGSACAPGPFGKTAPISGTTLAQTTSATLSWGASETAGGYDYCYDTTNDNTCSSWKSTKVLSATVTGLSPNTTYYWQVRATRSGTRTYANGKDTAYWSFKTAATTTLANALVGPLPWSAAPARVRSAVAVMAEELPTAAESSYDFQLEGEGFLLITRSDGKRAGVDPAGTFIAEIPGAQEIDYLTGLELNIPNILRIPHEPGYTYRISISDRPTAYGNQAALADLSIIGPGLVARLKGLKIDSSEEEGAVSGSNDVVGVTFDADTLRLGFTSSALDSDTPALNLAISQGGAADYTFEIGGAVMPSGRTLSAQIDPTTGALVIENDDPADNSYSLEVERINLDGSKTSYRFDTLSDGTGIGAVVDLGPGWTGGAPAVGQNTPPVAVADSYSTNADTALAVDAPGVLGNDSGAGLAAALVAGPAHGTLTLEANGAFVYTPASGYAGGDSFSYTANSGLYVSNVVTASITVNAAPVAADDAYTAVANTALSIGAPGVLGNDSDAEGNPLTAALVAGPAHGTLTLNPNGSFVYTPATGYVGSDSFSYTASDGAAVSNEATVSIAVRYAFTGFFAPVSNPPALNTVNAGQSVPVKFSLAGDFGLGIIAGGYPVSQPVNCTTGAPLGTAQATAANAPLGYDAGSGRYSYVWKTDSSWVGTCRLFTLRLADGTDHTALFLFH